MGKKPTGIVHRTGNILESLRWKGVRDAKVVDAKVRKAQTDKNAGTKKNAKNMKAAGSKWDEAKERARKRRKKFEKTIEKTKQKPRKRVDAGEPKAHTVKYDGGLVGFTDYGDVVEVHGYVNGDGSYSRIGYPRAERDVEALIRDKGFSGKFRWKPVRETGKIKYRGKRVGFTYDGRVVHVRGYVDKEGNYRIITHPGAQMDVKALIRKEGYRGRFKWEPSLEKGKGEGGAVMYKGRKVMFDHHKMENGEEWIGVSGYRGDDWRTGSLHNRLVGIKDPADQKEVKKRIRRMGRGRKATFLWGNVEEA